MLEDFPELNLVNSWAFGYHSCAEWLNNTIVLDSAVECWMCGELTVFAELNFEAPLCSEACNNTAWAQYIRACYNGDKRQAEQEALGMIEEDLP